MKRISVTLSIFCLLSFSLFSQNQVTEEAITLKTPAGDIVGILRIPNLDKSMPLAIIIAGSGPTDRDGNQPAMKNNSLKMLSEGLASNGIATLNFDKRGIAASKAAMKSESDIRFETYINDVRLWIEMLSKDKRFSSITLVGHSEGSLIGMIAAEDNSKVSKYVSIAGTGVTLDETLKVQLGKQLVSQRVVRDTCFSYIDRLKGGNCIPNVPVYLNVLFRPSVQPYLISVFKYNPQTEIKKLKIPILIIQGRTDIQVDPKNADILAEANPKAKKVLIENMCHVLKDCTGTDMSSQMPCYTNCDLPIDRKIVDEIADFIKH